jgi:glycosyltransferase involved in cell wall biosynthesis
MRHAPSSTRPPFFSREPTLNRSLSVLLPVRNVESSLAGEVEQILEVLAELTGRFELVIIDDRSTDGTWEVAQELAHNYPQIRLVADPIRHGPTQGIRLDVVAAYGEVVIAHDGLSRVDSREIVKLWRSLSGRVPAPKSIRSARTAVSSPASAEGPGREGPRTSMGRGLSRAHGFQLLRPGTTEELRRAIAAVQEVARKRPPSVCEPKQREDAPAVDLSGSAARMPNFVSRDKSRVDQRSEAAI